MKENAESIKNFLKSKGWHTWYNENYWVKEDLVEKELDYTDYGFTLDDAIKIEKLNKKQFKIKNKYGIPMLNVLDFLSKIGFNKRSRK